MEKKQKTLKSKGKKKLKPKPQASVSAIKRVLNVETPSAIELHELNDSEVNRLVAWSGIKAEGLPAGEEEDDTLATFGEALKTDDDESGNNNKDENESVAKQKDNVVKMINFEKLFLI